MTIRLLKTSWMVLLAGCFLWDPLDQPGLQMKFFPHDTALYVGASLMATGKMINIYGDTYPSNNIKYVGLDPNVSVTSSGKVTGLVVGRARIVARRDQFVDTGVVSVVPVGTLALSSFTSIDIADVDGSGWKPLVSAGQGQGDAAAWVFGRDSLVYSYGIPGGAGAADLYITDTDGNNRLLTRNGRDPRVTADRTWVYFTGSDIIERIHLDGTGREIVVPTTVAQPDPSPDGTQLVYFHLELAPGPVWVYEIRIRTLSDSVDRLLTTGLRPRWSPDGSHIAFWQGNVETLWGAIYAVDTAGNNLHQISLPGRLYRPDVLDWSPDGAWLVTRGQSALELIQVSNALSLPLGYSDAYLTASWRK